MDIGDEAGFGRIVALVLACRSYRGIEMNPTPGPVAGLLLDAADGVVWLRDWRFIRSGQLGDQIEGQVSRLRAVGSRIGAVGSRVSARLTDWALGLLGLLPSHPAIFFPSLVVGFLIWSTVTFFFLHLPMLALMSVATLLGLLYFIWFFLPLTVIALVLRLVVAIPAVIQFTYDYTLDLVQARRDSRSERSRRKADTVHG